MHITSEEHGDVLELKIQGRLDSEWADHLEEAIDQAVRQGSHSLILNLSEVSYVSSAGISTLLRAHKQFQVIRGFFGVGLAQPHVEEVFRMTRLDKLLLCDIEKYRRGTGGIHSTIQPMFRLTADAGTAFELYDIDREAELTCEVYGDPSRFASQAYSEANCRTFDFPAETFGLGLGALGRNVAECVDRLGEFLAVSGTAAFLPTSNAAKPDYQLSQGDYIPKVHVAYGLQCRGDMRHLQRFEPVVEGHRIPLSTLVNQCLKISETNAAGIVIVAETSGLIGVSLRRSPAGPDSANGSKMSHPEIRQWLSFSPERLFARSLVVVVGVAVRNGAKVAGLDRLQPLLRPVERDSDVSGHFHAAVFSYRPFKKRKLELNEIVGTLFDSEDLQSVMHLLNDDREITGGGQSEFVRGACWVSPITSVQGVDLK